MKRNVIRKSSVFVLALLVVFSLVSSCAPNQTSNSTSNDILSRIVSAGKIIVTFNTGNAPWLDKDPQTGGYKGISADLMEGFAKGIGITVEYMPLEFSSLIPAIQSGKADIIVTNLSRTVPRSTKILYTDPVGWGPGVCVFITGGSWTADSSLTDVNKAGVTLVAVAGTVHEQVAKDKFPNATLISVNENADAIAALKAGRAEIMLTGLDNAGAMKAADSTVDYFKQITFADSFAYAVKLSTDSYTFIQAFNNYLRLIKLDGTYGTIYQKYFGSPWVPNNIETGL